MHENYENPPDIKEALEKYKLESEQSIQRSTPSKSSNFKLFESDKIGIYMSLAFIVISVSYTLFTIKSVADKQNQEMPTDVKIIYSPGEPPRLENPIYE